MKKKQGISLIMLMITIIVIIVLVAAVIMTINKNNPSKAANEALFKNDLKSLAEKVNLEILTESIKDQNIINRVIQGDEMYEKYTPEAKDKYKVYIEKGELTINANEYTEEEIRWAKEANIRIGYLPVIEDVELTSTETSVTANVKMKTTGDYTYKYRIIGTGANDSWIDKKEATNKFSGLKTGTEYKVEVKVEENRKESDVVTRSITTNGISELVDIVPSTINWVQILTVKLTHSNIPTGYKLEYKINNGEWKEYTQDIELTTNSKVTARVYNSILNDAVGEISLDITNIDEIVPTAPTGITIVSKTENSITVKANGSTDTLSGIEGYKYSIDNTNWSAITNENYTINNIKSGTEVTVYAKAIDKVGLESVVYNSKGTTDVVNGTVNYSFNPGLGSYVNSNITVTLTATVPSGYELQYKIDSGSWTKYTSPFVVTQNGNIKTRIYNVTVNDEIVGTSQDITNIDKIAPTAPTVVSMTSNTVNSITVQASGATDSISGVVGYQYSTDNTNWSATTNTSYIINGIKAGTNVTVYARAVDRVNLVSTSKSQVLSTQGVTDVVSLNPNITNWTNGDVTVTLSHSNIPSGYVMQYKLGTGSFVTGNSVVVTSNIKVTGRLYNQSIDDEIAVASIDVTNIDKLVPAKVTVSLNGYTSGSWTNQNVVQTFSSTDTLSGIARYQVTVDGGANYWVEANPYTISWDGEWELRVRAMDNAGNVGEWSDPYVIRRKTTVPTAPSIPDLIPEHDTGIVNTDNVTMYWSGVRVVGTAQPNMTIHVRNWTVSNDPIVTTSDGNGNWGVNLNLAQNVWNTIQAWSGDQAGNWTESAQMQIYSDTIAPTVPTITYNGGANTCSWKNNYNLTRTSTDSATGIWKYQTNHNMDGNVHREYGANFVPENGYNTCTDRYRAVDGAGNVSGWTEPQHIHMDTVAPTLTNWWWGGVSNEVATLYIQAADNASGIIRVQCPAASEASGYNDWIWRDAWWDAGANAYRVDIPASNGRYGNYKVHLYMYDNAGNGGFIAESSPINIIPDNLGGYVDGVPIPKGFVVSGVTGENTKDGGLVIKEGNDPFADDRNVNEFVWIPIDYTNDTEFANKFIRKEGYYRESPQNNLRLAPEPYDEDRYEYNAMVASVKKYHGFYISRYEISKDANGKAQSKRYASPWNEIPVKKYNTTEGATEKSRAMYPVEIATQGCAVSTLIYGVQWDTAIDFIENYGVKDKTYRIRGALGYYASMYPTITGGNKSYSLNNIYDMAGNVSEWSMERVPRGSNYSESGKEIPASFRGYVNSSGAGYGQGFRIALYIKQ